MNYRRTNLVLALLFAGLLVTWVLLPHGTANKSSDATQWASITGVSKENGQTAGGIWRLRVTLDMPSLDLPAVQWAILSEDPKLRLREDLKGVESALRTPNDPQPGAEMRTALTLSQYVAAWDHLFKLVTGDELYLLTSGPGVANGFASNMPGGKKWLVTKSARSGNVVYCWSIPFEAVPGQDTAIQFKSENASNLADLAAGRD